MSLARRTLIGAALLSLLAAPSVYAAGTYAPAEPGKIFFSRDSIPGPGNDYDIHAINPDGSGLVNLTPGLATSQFTVSIDPRGRRIAFRNGDGTAAQPFDIWTKGLDGSPAVPLTSDLPTDFAPFYSPDGTRVAFTRDLDTTAGAEFDVMLVNADGSGLRNLTNTAGVDEFGSSFSPDGNRVLFHAPGAGGFNELNQIKIDGSGRASFAVSASLAGEEERPALSPDGKRLVFVSLNLPDVDLFVAAADGSNPVNITTAVADDAGDPSWSPDGSRLAWDDDGGDLFTIAATGGAATPLTNDPAIGDTQPQWEHVFRCAGRRATIVGDDGPDKIKGTKKPDVIVTNAGKDFVRGRGGKDRICGGRGKDKLIGGPGADVLKGGKGRDIERQ